MVTFSVPCRSGSSVVVRIRPQAVAFAGSRNGAVHKDTAAALVEGFHHLGFGFLTGCAPGIDRGFRFAFLSNIQTILVPAAGVEAPGLPSTPPGTISNPCFSSPHVHRNRRLASRSMHQIVSVS